MFIWYYTSYFHLLVHSTIMLLFFQEPARTFPSRAEMGGFYKFILVFFLKEGGLHLLPLYLREGRVASPHTLLEKREGGITSHFTWEKGRWHHLPLYLREGRVASPPTLLERREGGITSHCTWEKGGWHHRITSHFTWEKGRWHHLPLPGINARPNHRVVHAGTWGRIYSTTKQRNKNKTNGKA